MIIVFNCMTILEKISGSLLERGQAVCFSARSWGGFEV